MNTERKPLPFDPYELPGGTTVRELRFGTSPVSPFVPTPAGGDVGDASAPRVAYKIRWEDHDQGLKVVIRERDNGHLVADVSCKDATLLGRAAVSVGLVGAAEHHTIRKTIPLDVPEEIGCSGSADLGPLSEATQKLGQELGVVVFLLVCPAP